MAANRNETTLQALKTVWSRGGITGFYQGLIPWVRILHIYVYMSECYPSLLGDHIEIDKPELEYSEHGAVEHSRRRLPLYTRSNWY